MNLGAGKTLKKSFGVESKSLTQKMIRMSAETIYTILYRYKTSSFSSMRITCPQSPFQEHGKIPLGELKCAPAIYILRRNSIKLVDLSSEEHKNKVHTHSKLIQGMI